MNGLKKHSVHIHPESAYRNIKAEKKEKVLYTRH